MKEKPLEARNAVRIAKWAGADVSAADSFDKATRLLARQRLIRREQRAVEGHTDGVGTDDNQSLSENHANSVRNFLIGQGIASASASSHGFGGSQPVASNDTAAGRWQTRRVELVVSGDIIAGLTGSTADARRV